MQKEISLTPARSPLTCWTDRLRRNRLQAERAAAATAAAAGLFSAISVSERDLVADAASTVNV
jgi:hypothetical protein